MRSKNKLGPIEYYDNISLKYDDTLNSNQINTKIREEVKQYFLKNVKGKYVLDFGGGTGKDVEWLTKNGFTVYFCEPARRMRELAIKIFHKSGLSGEVIFLNDENSVYQNWISNDHPFEHKVNGILANFAVLNSIKRIEILSEKLALITHPGAHLIVSVLAVRLNKIFSRDFLVIFKLYLTGNGLATIVKDEDHQMIVYMHTKKKLVKSLNKNFDYVESLPVSGSTFKLFHFRRNEKDFV
jgi:2-polyprenyl-3-methyl-5-hydroxy-6-metoxy-1,4-benzoquinol methylase